MYASFSFHALGGPNSVRWLSGPSDEELGQKLVAEALRIQAVFSRYDPLSIVSLINQAAGSGPVRVDEETAGLLSFSARLFEVSGGLFDITSGVLRKVWNYSSGIVPREEDVQAILPLVGWNKTRWEPPYFSLPTPGMEIDLGGLGKEYAAGRLRSILVSAGVKSALINLGGDVTCIGLGPEGRPWRVGIAHPREASGAAAALGLVDTALATSGDYERCMMVQGKRYCHILNPKTGFPDVTASSVSVVAESCLLAGALSTTAMLLAPEARAAFFNELGVSALVLDEQGKIAERYGPLVPL
jgi:thiamine biosynthesis lipoprotein